MAHVAGDTDTLAGLEVVSREGTHLECEDPAQGT